MKTFSAKELHENPSKVYRAATREPVKITHRNHGEMYLVSDQTFKDMASICENHILNGYDPLSLKLDQVTLPFVSVNVDIDIDFSKEGGDIG